MAISGGRTRGRPLGGSAPRLLLSLLLAAPVARGAQIGAAARSSTGTSGEQPLPPPPAATAHHPSSVPPPAFVEPICEPRADRFVLFPLQHRRLWEMYKKHEACFWTAEEIDLGSDATDWERLSDGERHFISHVLAFFAASDGIVVENLAQRFCAEVQIPEVRFHAPPPPLPPHHSQRAPQRGTSSENMHACAPCAVRRRPGWSYRLAGSGAHRLMPTPVVMAPTAPTAPSACATGALLLRLPDCDGEYSLGDVRRVLPIWPAFTAHLTRLHRSSNPPSPPF